MPLARRVKAANGRYTNVPRRDTITAWIVAHPFDMTPVEISKRGAKAGLRGDTIISLTSTARKAYAHLEWFDSQAPTVPPVDRAELLSPNLLRHAAELHTPPAVKTPPEVRKVIPMRPTPDPDDVPPPPPLPGRGPTHVVGSPRAPVPDVIPAHVEAPSDLRAVPAAFTGLRVAADPPPTAPGAPAPAIDEASIRAWIEMGASLLDQMVVSESALRARSIELAAELTRLQAEHTDVTRSADALAACIGVVRASAEGAS